MTTRSENKVLYTSVDRRYNLHEMTAEPEFIATVKKQARSVACMLFGHQLIYDTTSKSYRLNSPKTFSQKLSENGWILGEKERFSSEPAEGFGTGFLIGPKTILTAGHCVCKENGSLDQARITATRIVFGYKILESGSCRTTFKEKNVCKIQAVPFFEYTKTPDKCTDFAICTLEKEVEKKEPLRINFSHVPDDSALFMLGYPCGLPLKYTDIATIKKNNNAHFFEINIDAFAGNSGSPLFLVNNKNGVAGILCSGNKDFEVDPNYDGKPGSVRYKVHRITDNEIKTKGYEKCQRTSSLTQVRNYIANDWNKLHPGLNIEIKCTSGTCIFQQNVFVPKDFGRFHMNKVVCTTLCSYCDQKVKPTGVITFKNCTYSYEGMHNDTQIEEQEKTIQNQTTLNILGWQYCDIQVGKIS